MCRRSQDQTWQVSSFFFFCLYFPLGFSFLMFSLLQCTREHISATWVSATWDATILEKKKDLSNVYSPRKHFTQIFICACRMKKTRILYEGEF